MLLLSSKITKSLLSYYFLHEDGSLYVNEIVRRLGVDKRNLVKKLREFEKEGILASEQKGNQKYYSLNKKYPLYKEYKKIVMKTIGFEEKLRATLNDVKGINSAFIFGSYARDRMDSHSDIDLLVVGAQDTIPLQKQINKLQKEIDREINVISISQQEFDSRRKKKDPFISEIIRKEYLKII